jgi:competence ComEA-like helix-hairpin-helix protein
MDPRERRALVTVLLLAAGGHVVRRVQGPPAAAAIDVLDPATAADPLTQVARIDALARPLGPGERLDPDRATVAQLARLPGVGPALARRIVADRESLGVFGDITTFGRVRGIGPATLDRLAPRLTFGGRPAEATGSVRPETISVNRAGPRDLVRLPGIGEVKAAAIVAFRDSAGPFRQIGDLERVPGISGTLVARLSGLIRLD